MNRRALTVLPAAVAMAAVLALAGCTAGGDVGAQQPPAGGPPLPGGAKEVANLPEASADTSCDPTASLRPNGTPDDSAGPTVAKIRARGKLIVGVDQNTYQFGYRNPVTGEVEGFDIDMAREIAKAIFGTDKGKLQLKVLTSAQRVPAVKSGDVDLVVETMTINCERRKDVEFSSVYYMAGQKVLVKDGSGYTGIESLGGKKVCAANGSTSIANIVNAPVDPKPMGVGVDSWTDCLVMLQQNQVDAVSTDDTILAGLKAQDPFTSVVGDRFTDEPYGMAMSKNAPDFTRFVNAVLEELRTSGQWKKIYDKWLLALLETSAAPPAARYRD